jgi:putative nucleotidyltransferase with HDIG domain
MGALRIAPGAADYRKGVSRIERLLLVGQLGLLAFSAAFVVAYFDASDWRPLNLFGLLLALAVISEHFRLKMRKAHVSASFLALVLATVLLGPAPAAIIGVTGMLLNAARRRTPWKLIVANVSTYAFFPIVGAVIFDTFGDPALAIDDGASYVVLVSLVFMAMNVLNFLLIAADIVAAGRMSLGAALYQLYAPLLPVQVASALLTAGVAFVYYQVGLGAVGLLAMICLVFQYLLRTALDSVERKEQLEGRTRELASLQVGLLTTVLQTLSLRDKMTARHSAAVARYAREMARAISLPPAEEELVHTAGLLHDIGKFIFPDSILLADTRLTDEQFEIVKRHPEQGAKLVRRIDGYGRVAEIIHAHHERIDGRGYPRGLVGEDIPIASRIISIADTYDVMTSRDSYRKPVSPHEAIAELRRVSGSQLDAQLVEVFIGLVEQRTIRYRHADDAEFERELNFESRVREHAAPRAAAA